MDEHQVDAQSSLERESEDGIIWRESSDVFRPSVRPLHDFIREVNLKDINPEFAPYIFFETSAYDRMWKDASRDTSREHGGILVGEPFEDPGARYYVVVRAAVAAHEPSGSPTHLQFRPESWKPIWDKLYSEPTLRIVGWYHTHPGLGVFLSGTDLRTQRLYFAAPWHIAIVIDPAAGEIGYFFGSSGKKAPFIWRFSPKVDEHESTTPSQADEGS
jgi:proteasome lid subunit RPN8/RPN11